MYSVELCQIDDDWDILNSPKAMLAIFSKHESTISDSKPLFALKKLLQLYVRDVSQVLSSVVPLRDKLPALRSEMEQSQNKLKEALFKLEHQSIAMTKVEEICQHRIEESEHQRAELELKCFQTESDRGNLQKEIELLSKEANSQKQTILNIQQEKKDLLNQSITVESFADTYEVVMQQEFDTMKETLTRRMQSMEKQMEEKRKETNIEIQQLIKKQKEERLSNEAKLRRAATEIQVLTELCHSK